MPANPDLTSLLDAMILHAYTDLQDPNGYLRPVLDAYGVTIDTTSYVDPMGAITGDPAMYNGLVFGDPDPADGCSIHFVPTPIEESWKAVPSQRQADYLVLIRAIWKDNPDQVMQSSNRRYWRFLTGFTESLQALFSPDGLQVAAGGWIVGDGMVLDPQCTIADPASEVAIRGQIRLQGEIEFSCFTFYPLTDFSGGGGGSDDVTRGIPTDRSGTITTGGTAQVLMAANPTRSYWSVWNPSDATESLWVNYKGSSATPASPSREVTAGGNITFNEEYIPNGSISIYGATTGHAFEAEEG